MQSAQKLFTNQGIKITDQGECLLGSVIGTEPSREQYIKNKVKDWVKDLQLLSKYAQDDSQPAYSAFKGLCFRWTHFQRTVPDMSESFEPQENAIRKQLIPALLGQEVSDAEKHEILGLPLRHGGLGLTDPRETTKKNKNTLLRSLIN